VATWQQIHEAVSKSIHMLELDIDATMVDDRTLAEVITKPRNALAQIKDALQSQDHVLLADVLQYEFHDVAADWHTVLASLIDAAKGTKTDPSQS
jgi:hypothetical protein